MSFGVAIPIALRVVYYDRFVRGPFHLGRYSYPIATVAVLWIAFITIAFILPQENPVDSQTLNYAIVAVGIVITYSVGFWLLSARKWFTGPVKQIAGEQSSQGYALEFGMLIANCSGRDGIRHHKSCDSRRESRVQEVEGVNLFQPCMYIPIPAMPSFTHSYAHMHFRS